ncbi:MAG: DMT family transporter [Bacteroidales bacterium]|nr:DMT family transporter [Bacteroidales bacterium]MBO7487613.1 DMT family transporter [Bacteroidales bacterium]
MWISTAFIAAVLYGFYDSFKKLSLRGNAVLPVLFLNTLICSALLIPWLVLSKAGSLEGTVFHVAGGDWQVHKYILLKSFIVLSSWASGYYALKNLPLSIVGPVNATRPVMVLLGGMLFFGERLNLYQWAGVFFAALSFYLLGRGGKKEGIDFTHDKWVFLLILSAVIGAASGLYDRFLLAPVEEGGVGLDRMTVLVWYNIYQCIIMLAVLLLVWRPQRSKDTPFEWRAAIPMISIFLVTADFVYMYTLAQPDSMVGIVSMVKRSSVVVSFLFAALFLKEKNLRSKAFDLLLVLIGMVFLYLGSR